MAQGRSLTSAYDIVDWTSALNEIPNTYGLTQELGIFRNESVAQNVVQFESYKQTLALVTDQYRGTRNTVSSDDTRKAHAFILAHFPLDDFLTARELVGKRAYGQLDTAETELAAITRKMERVRKSHAQTAEVARGHTLVTGTQFAPNGTVSANFYTDFGVTRKVVEFNLTSTSAGLVRDKSREAVDHIQTNILSGEMPTSHVGLASPGFFDKLVNQAGVHSAWLATQTAANYNTTGFRSGQYDQITFGGIRYIRYLAYRPDGSPMIPDDECYILPLGTDDVFLTYFGPAERFDTINTLGEEAYMWSERSKDNTSIKISTESNFVNLIRRPQCVVKAIAGTL